MAHPKQAAGNFPPSRSAVPLRDRFGMATLPTEDLDTSPDVLISKSSKSRRKLSSSQPTSLRPSYAPRKSKRLSDIDLRKAPQYFAGNNNGNQPTSTSMASSHPMANKYEDEFEDVLDENDEHYQQGRTRRAGRGEEEEFSSASDEFDLDNLPSTVKPIRSRTLARMTKPKAYNNSNTTNNNNNPPANSTSNSNRYRQQQQHQQQLHSYDDQEMMAMEVDSGYGSEGDRDTPVHAKRVTYQKQPPQSHSQPGVSYSSSQPTRAATALHAMNHKQSHQSSNINNSNRSSHRHAEQQAKAGMAPKGQHHATEPSPSFARIPESYDELKLGYENLLTRFDRLSALRETTSEQMLTDYKRLSESRHTASEQLIEALRQENEQLRQACNAGGGNSGMQMGRPSLGLSELVGAIKDFDGQSQDTASLLDVYAQLSGLKLTKKVVNSGAKPSPASSPNNHHQHANDTPSPSATWLAEIQGRHGGYSFELSLDAQDSSFTYTPIKTLPQLPSYLKEEIVFDKEQGQAFFWRVLNFLMQSNSTTTTNNNSNGVATNNGSSRGEGAKSGTNSTGEHGGRGVRYQHY